MRVSLPKRTRFYHAKIDADSLASGEDYSKLKNVTVIFISPYDPFQRNRMVYTIKNGCVEEPDLDYNDGMKTLFLYTKGTEGNPPEELQRLLHYLEDSREENAKDADLMSIHRMVQTVKQDKEVSLEYMKILERERMIREEGREEGIKEGKRDGYASGKAELIRIIRKKKEKGMSSAETAGFLEMKEEEIRKIFSLLDEDPDAADLEIARKALGFPESDKEA